MVALRESMATLLRENSEELLERLRWFSFLKGDG